MSFPTITVEVDYTTNALTIPTTWTDLSSRFRSGTIQVGRQRILDRTEVGRGRLVLDNQDGGLDTGTPLNHIRVIATSGGVQYPLMRHYVQSWPQQWPARKDAISPVETEDAFSLLSRYELEGQSIGSMGAGAHISSVLTTYGWPAAGTIPAGKTWWQLGNATNGKLGTSTYLGESLSQIATGRSTIMATTLTGNLLDHLLNVAETTDGGTFYVGPNGDLIFTERPGAFAPSIGVWGDDPEASEQRYGEIEIEYGVTQLYNDIRVTRRGDTNPQVATEPTGYFGTTNAGKRTLSLSDVLHSTTGAAASRASELLADYKEPALHFIRLVMRPKKDGVWGPYLSRKLMDRITVKRRPPGGGLIQRDCLITGITYDITPNGWTITWALAPTVLITNGWYLGHSGYSELGTTTRLK